MGGKASKTKFMAMPDIPATGSPVSKESLDRVLQRTEEVLRFVPSPALFQVVDNLSAGLILASVVPHGVVPAVVTEHVLGPFIHVPPMSHSVQKVLEVCESESAQGKEHGDFPPFANWIGVPRVHEKKQGLHLGPWLGPGGAALAARLPELSQFCSTFRFVGFGYLRSPWHSEISPEQTALYHLADWYHGPKGDCMVSFRIIPGTMYYGLSSTQMMGSMFKSNDTNHAVTRVTRKGRPYGDHPFERCVAWIDLVMPRQPKMFQNLRTIIIEGDVEICNRTVIHLALVQEAGAFPSLRRIEMQRPVPHFAVCALTRSALGRSVQEFNLALVRTAAQEDHCLAEYLFWLSDQCPLITDDDRSLLRRSLTVEYDQRGQDEVAGKQVAAMDALAAQRKKHYPDLDSVVKLDAALLCRDLAPLAFTHLQQVSIRP